MFDKSLTQHGDNICLITKREKFSYNDVNNICTTIEKKVLSPEKQLIVIKAKNNIETIIGYLSFLRANHTVIMLDAFMDKEFFQNIIKKYKPNLIWEEKSESLNYVVGYKNYGLRIENLDKLSLHPNLSLMLSTSGTTGSPKMVKLTKKNLYANCNSIVEYLNIDKYHRVITNLPLFYSYGISILNTHLARGASVVITDESIMSKEFWNIFKKNNVTTLNGVPYHYEIFRRIGLAKMELPKLRFLTQAGGKLNHKIVREFAVWAKNRDIHFFVCMDRQKQLLGFLIFLLIKF